MIEQNLDNFQDALDALKEGKEIVFLCKHHTYKMIDGNVVCMSDKVEKEYPFDGFTKEEMEANWVVVNG